MPDKPSTTEFCPTQNDLYPQLMALLPPGRAFGRHKLNNPGNIELLVEKLMYAIAGEGAKMELAMCQALDEWFCFSASVDMDLWKADYGVPDECDIYSADVCSKVGNRYRSDADYLMYLLSTNGFIGEGRWLKGSDVEYPGVKSTFVVVIDPTISPAFLTGTDLPFFLDGTPLLGDASLEQALCMLERYVPAHCAIIGKLSGEFNPENPALATKIKLWYTAEDFATGDLTDWVPHIGVGTVTSSGTGIPVVEDSTGFKYVQFTGTEYYGLASPAGLPVGDDESTILTLAHQSADYTADVNDRFMVSYGNTAHGRAIYRHNRTTPNVNSYAISDDDAGPPLMQSSKDFIAGPHSGYGTFVDDVVHGSFDGAIIGTGTASAPTFTTVADTLRIGAGVHDAVPVDTTKFIGKIRHIFITAGLTPAERVQLEAWMAWDVGRPDILPSNHPYRNLRP